MVLSASSREPGTMADIFDVVADETRRDILGVLRERSEESTDDNEISVSEIVAVLAVSQPTVSKHLRVLRDAGLVIVREEGQHRFYRLETTPLEDIEDWLIPFLATTAAAEAATLAHPEARARAGLNDGGGGGDGCRDGEGFCNNRTPGELGRCRHQGRGRVGTQQTRRPTQVGETGRLRVTAGVRAARLGGGHRGRAAMLARHNNAYRSARLTRDFGPGRRNGAARFRSQ